MELVREYSSDEDGAQQATQPASRAAALIDDDAPKKTARGKVTLMDSTEAKASDLFVREIPHSRGNWAGHVFVQIPSIPSSFRRRANLSVASFCSCLENAGWTGMVISHTSNLHISLSRPFFLQQSSIDSFVHSLQQRLCYERGTNLLVKGEKLLVNDNGTRSFWCWSLTSNPCVQRILECVDQVMLEYKQCTYYEAPEFHVSLASLPGSVEQLLLERRVAAEGVSPDAKEGDTASEDESSDDDNTDGPLIISLDHIDVTFGTTKSFRIDLKT
mmetsp:Transcript_20795/g.37775  ORF Transcript_20795/g.37775 Transcript_20795/m.37775 type:complete len:273 (+) Transcript_20795:152-970(+)